MKVPDGQGGMVATSVYAQAREERRKLELAEKHRQLYVAMTRAEKYLCLVNVDETKEDGKKSGSSGQEKWGQSIQRVFAPDGPNGDQMDSEELDVAEVLAADLAAGSGEQAKAFTLDPAVYDRVQPVVVRTGSCGFRPVPCWNTITAPGVSSIIIDCRCRASSPRLQVPVRAASLPSGWAPMYTGCWSCS